MYTTIKTLWERTKNKTEIARLTCHNWKTMAKGIKNLEKGIETQGLTICLISTDFLFKGKDE